MVTQRAEPPGCKQRTQKMVAYRGMSCHSLSIAGKTSYSMGGTYTIHSGAKCASEKKGAVLLNRITLHGEGVPQLNPVTRCTLGLLLPSPSHCFSYCLVQFDQFCHTCSVWEKGTVSLGTTAGMRQCEE